VEMSFQKRLDFTDKGGDCWGNRPDWSYAIGKKVDVMTIAARKAWETSAPGQPFPDFENTTKRKRILEGTASLHGGENGEKKKKN